MREERKKGKKKGIYTILMLICAVVFLFALYKVVDILMEYKQIDDFYDGAQEEYVDLDSQKIPYVTEAIPELIDTEREDIGSAIRDVQHCIDFTELKESTFRILELALIDMIDKAIDSAKEDYFEQYYLSCFRTLASVIDRQLYSDTLKTIED